MKQFAVGLGLAALLLAGCGKSAEERHLEAELWAKVTSMHDKVMAETMEFGDLEQKIDAAMARHEELAKRYARELKGHTAEDLQAARTELESLRTKMDNWMKGFKPYDEALPHQDAMASLETSLQWLTSMQGEIEKAVTQAETSLAEHQAAAETLTKKGR